MNYRLKAKIIEYQGKSNSKMTMYKIEKELGLHATMLTKIIHGIKIARPEERAKIAGYLGCKEEDIFDEPEKDKSLSIVNDISVFEQLETECDKQQACR